MIHCISYYPLTQCIFFIIFIKTAAASPAHARLSFYAKSRISILLPEMRVSLPAV